MSSNPTANVPPPACVEDEDENTQKPVPGSKMTANVKTKGSEEPGKIKRDAASDSGYSSLTATTRGSSSQGSKDGTMSKSPLTRLRSKVANAVGKASAKEPATSSKSVAKKPIEKTQRRNSVVVRGTPHISRKAIAILNLLDVADQGIEKNTKPQRPVEDHKVHSPVKPPPIAQWHVPPRPIPIPLRVQTTSRPESYHGPPLIYAQAPVYQYRPQPPPPPPPPSSLPSVIYTPIERNSPTTYFPTYLSHSASRQTPYPFQPTVPPAHPPSPQWTHPEGYYHPQPSGYIQSRAPPSRRYSMHGAPPSAPIVEYPTVPRPPRRYEFADPVSHRQPRASAEVISFVPSPIEDEAIVIDDEIYYRDRDREIMPPPPVPQRPPQRPAFRHSASTSAAIQRPKRQSLELPSHSPKTHSFEDPRPAPRPLTRSRGSITRHSTNEAGISKPPVALRRRPVSMHSHHEPTDPVKEAEDHMAKQKSQDQQLPLTTDAVRQVENRTQLLKPRKPKSKGGSEAGSRASSSRDGSEAKRRAHSDYHANVAAQTRKGIKLHIQTNEPVQIDMGSDSIQVRHGYGGHEPAEMSVGGSHRSRYREPRYYEGRSRDSRRDEKQYRTYSVNSRHDEIRRLKEHGESGATSRRRSSSRSVTSRKEPEERSEELIQKLKHLNDQTRPQRYETAVEEEEEARKAQHIDLAPTERVRKLRTDSQSRRSSRSTTTRRAMAGGATNSP